MRFDWTKVISKDEMEKVKSVLMDGGVIIFPTDTVYGIAASAFSDKGIEKIYEAKKRPRNKAINIMVYDIDEISNYVKINDIENKIIEKFMPGEITIILDKKQEFGPSFTKKDTIGVRIPNSKIALEILKEVKIPLIVSSANISGSPSVTDPKDLDVFKNSADIIIDGGIIDRGIPSTIVRVDNDINILRKGKITKKQLENVILE